ncbi:MAG TPA: ribonuclease P protein subunit [Candidatus Nitrosopelagicus sp.]|nr:ribonuclease P protein subunit [Candidatus Nitrosopelagicus sp.]
MIPALQSEFDIIGQDVTISDSNNKEIIGIKGKITMETKNMFIINTKNGKKNIPKNICQLSNYDGIIETDSSKLSKRPHERLEMLS